MRTAVLFILLPTALAADVVVLKEGGRVSGRVVDKQSHWEVTTEQGLRTYLKDEVDRVITSPQEFLGDADQQFEQVKQDYQKALGISAPAEQNAALKDAIARLSKAREAYSGARDLFPEDKHVGMDQKLMQIMQLMRLLRERVSSEVARSVVPGTSSTGTPRVDRPAVPSALHGAFAMLSDAGRRGDSSSRKAAGDVFREQRAGVPDLYDLATAAMLFLSKNDAEWKLTGPGLAALQEYLCKPWIKDTMNLTPAAHQEAAAFLADKIAALRKADSSASAEALLLFAIGHLGCAPVGLEREKVAKALGLAVTNGLPGTPEGLALRDLNLFISLGEYDLAGRLYVNDYRGIDTSALRLVWSWSLLELAVQKKKGFDRAISGLSGLKGDLSVVANAVALAASIQTATPCSNCGGDGWLRCTNCHGQKTIYNICKACNGARMSTSSLGAGVFCSSCKGTGIASKIECEKCKDGYSRCPKCKLPNCEACGSSARTRCPTCRGLKVIKSTCQACGGKGTESGRGGGKGAGMRVCASCKGSGNEKIAKCSTCTNGFLDCPKCEPLRKPPTLEDICTTAPCVLCEGRGLAFRRVAWPCKACMGLGQKLTPKSGSGKVLQD